MKSNKNLTLGLYESFIARLVVCGIPIYSIYFDVVFNVVAVLHENPIPSNSVFTEPEKIEDKHSPVKLRNKTKRIAEVSTFKIC